MNRFRPIDRETDYLLPPSVQDRLPGGTWRATSWMWLKR
jgi:hypothetical protein